MCIRDRAETVNWNMTDAYSLCRTCANFKSLKCPNSKECFDNPKKPYYKARHCDSATLLYWTLMKTSFSLRYGTNLQ